MPMLKETTGEVCLADPNDGISGPGSRCSRQFPPNPGEYRPAQPSTLLRRATRTTVSSQTGVHLENVRQDTG